MTDHSEQPIHPENTVVDMLNQHRDEYRYLLLDPLKTVSSVNPLHLLNLQQMLGDSAIHPVLRSDLAYSPSYCPQLVLLASPSERCEFPWLVASQAYARGEVLHEKRYVCAWLSSPMPSEQLATALANQCDQLSENAFTALFEPLCFELLQAMTQRDGLAGNLWPVSHWWYMTIAGDIACQTGSATEEKWRMNWGAERALRDRRALWQLLLAWQQVRPILPTDAVIQAEAASAKAAKTGLADRDGRNFLALNSLTLAVDIEQHPAVQAVLQQALANPTQRFIQLLLTLPETVWQTLEGQITPQQNTDKGIDRHGT
ncbi:hypothetical protein ACX1F1_17560 [Yersinia pseudotuberculosis]|uniref:hypothetical protein n=1 Tax=Yersinia pseudotuberculosis TaxID=633 RepID=UPI001A9E2869|nr:hypothetical protein [Yersinia pseudotuberculosis]MBO1631979.1 hypothetical protein [Yersinia pseudotuberculosis]MBP0069838.1 hypothetical protein [Yersinia pseudotuberculosis]